MKLQTVLTVAVLAGVLASAASDKGKAAALAPMSSSYGVLDFGLCWKGASNDSNRRTFVVTVAFERGISRLSKTTAREQFRNRDGFTGTSRRYDG